MFEFEFEFEFESGVSNRTTYRILLNRVASSEKWLPSHLNGWFQIFIHDLKAIHRSSSIISPDSSIFKGY